MPATKENQYWKLRNRHGKPPKYDDAETLWVDACKYFDYITDNPFEKEVIYSFNGKTVKGYLTKQRPFSVTGFCVFLGIPKRSFYNLGNDARLMHIFTRVREIIWLNQFEGACAGIFNANIIWRKLCLVSKSEIDTHVKRYIPPVYINQLPKIKKRKIIQAFTPSASENISLQNSETFY